MLTNLKARLAAMNTGAKPVEPREARLPEENLRVVRKVYGPGIPGFETISDALTLSPQEVSVLCRTELPPGFSMRDALFLDTETTGLSGGAGVLAFLVGIGWFEEDDFILEQYFLEDYDAESAMLHALAERVAKCRFLVTFNGKTFDVPLLSSRAVLERLRLMPSDLPHLDLLHACRRMLKRRLERCNFSAIEEELLDFRREGDIPGDEIPEVYLSYLKNRSRKPEMEKILSHNALDVVHMPMMLSAMIRMLHSPESLSFEEDTLSCGILWERSGNLERAVSAYEALPENTDALRHLSLIRKRAGEWDEALSIWRYMAKAGKGGLFPYEEAAKAYEHHYHDLDRAIHSCEVFLQKMKSYGIMQGKAFTDMQSRLMRLNNIKKRKESRSS